MICINAENTKDLNAAAIQNAVETAKRSGEGMVVIENGEWIIEKPVCLYDNIHIHIENARLTVSDNCKCAFENYNISLPRVRSIYGRQKGITISGSGDATICGKQGIYFYNIGDLSISGLCFEKCEKALELVYANHFRISDLKFKECLQGLNICVGSRNGFIHDFEGECDKWAVLFDSSERDEVVYYNGPQVENHIVRSISVSCNEKVRICGEDVKFIEIEKSHCE